MPINNRNVCDFIAARFPVLDQRSHSNAALEAWHADAVDDGVNYAFEGQEDGFLQQMID
jgi:hypothetical protein